jgi:CubicO group peptidase (beta-lactamase class C family)
MTTPGFDQLDRYLRHWLSGVPAPGMTLAVTDRHRTLHTANAGFRNRDAGLPVTGDTTFQIGSIGKSMTALALMQLVEAGRLDLNAPLSTHLPWFTPTSRHGPVALQHVLSHTAGLPTGSDFTPSSRYEAYALRDVAIPWEPGTRFHYSNTGYKMLGWLLEGIERASYADIISRRILDPSGMSGAVPAVTHATRHRMATGYVPLHDDRPYRRDDTLIPATWMEYDAGDGSPAATAADLASYARMWLNRGRGPLRPLVSTATFDRMVAPFIRMDRGDAYEHDYGYGFGIISHTADGRRFIGHGGSTVGFQAIMLIDQAESLAAVLLCNGNGVDTYAPARYALQVTAAVRDAAPIPEPPTMPDPYRVDGPSRYVGNYVNIATSGRLSVRNDDGRLLVESGSDSALEQSGGIALLNISGNTFCVPDDAFDPFPLRFHATTADGDDAMAEVHHGGSVYVREETATPDSPGTDPTEWAALVGHYRSHAPYVSNFRVIQRRGSLYLAWPHGGEEAITPETPDERASGWFAVGPPGEPTAERIRFAPIVAGRALRVQWIGGGDFYRVN